MALASWATYSETWASTSDEWNPTYLATATFSQNLGQTSDTALQGVGAATLDTNLSSIVNVNQPCSIALTNDFDIPQKVLTSWADEVTTWDTSSSVWDYSYAEAILNSSATLSNNLSSNAGEDVVMTFTAQLDLNVGFPDEATDSWDAVATTWATDGTTWEGIWATVAVPKSAQLDAELTKTAEEDQIMAGSITITTNLGKTVGEDQVMPGAITFTNDLSSSASNILHVYGLSTLNTDLSQASSSVFTTTGIAQLDAALTQIHNVNHPVSITIPVTLDELITSSFLWEVLSETSTGWSDIAETNSTWSTQSEATSVWTRRDMDGDGST